DKASRKNVPRSKQLSHMRIRRSVNQALANVRGEVDESVALGADASVKARTKLLGRKAFKKRPDKPLGVVIEKQKTERYWRAIKGALRRAGIIPSGTDVRIDVGRGFGTFVRFEDASRAREVIREFLRDNPRD
ncbi:MAG: hypothetical protein WA434_10135, partial [Candidatus Acidiferrales bacterium]